MIICRGSVVLVVGVLRLKCHLALKKSMEISRLAGHRGLNLQGAQLDGGLPRCPDTTSRVWNQWRSLIWQATGGLNLQGAQLDGGLPRCPDTTSRVWNQWRSLIWQATGGLNLQGAQLDGGLPRCPDTTSRVWTQLQPGPCKPPSQQSRT